MSHITYEEAARLLNKKKDTIAHAVSDGVLTRYPSASKEALLITEQVGLFKGKPLSKRALNDSEHQQWQVYADSVHQPKETVSPVGSEVPQGSNFIPPEMKEYIDKGYRVKRSVETWEISLPIPAVA